MLVPLLSHFRLLNISSNELLNKSGDRGSPCLTPFSMLKYSLVTSVLISLLNYRTFHLLAL